MTFSDKIKLAREAAHLSQQQLADETGVSKRTIASYESGGAHARRGTLLRLAAALRVSSEYLAHDDCLDPSQGLEKDGPVAAVYHDLGAGAADEFNELLVRNTALLAGGELSEEAKDRFYAAVTQAYLLSKQMAKEKYGKK